MISRPDEFGTFHGGPHKPSDPYVSVKQATEYFTKNLAGKYLPKTAPKAFLAYLASKFGFRMCDLCGKPFLMKPTPPPGTVIKETLCTECFEAKESS